jgi:hypothetical protein
MLVLSLRWVVEIHEIIDPRWFKFIDIFIIGNLIFGLSLFPDMRAILKW